MCIRCIVSGKVQGVFFRASTREQALQLGLVGYAKNLPTGDVIVVACGAEQSLDKLKGWLVHGPGQARVDKLDCRLTSEESFSNFNIY